MAHGVSEMLSPEASPTGAKQHQQPQQQAHHQSNNLRKSVGVMGSRRIFAPAFKLKVLNSYRHDLDCRGNQRATARKYNIHRRQIQKWLQCEDSLRNCCAASGADSSGTSTGSPSPDSTQQHPPVQQQQQQHQSLQQQPATLNPSRARLHGDEQQQQPPPPPQPQQQQQSSAAAAAAAAAATGYRFLPQPHHYDYPHPQLIYQAPPPAAAATAAAVPYQYAGFQPPAVHYTPADEAMMISEIKREPASPDSAFHHLHHHHHHHHQLLKKERLDDEVCNTSFSSGISDASSSSSPVPSHLESLPPSPRESTGSSGSDSEEADSSSGFQQHSIGADGNAAAADLARRRSFSLRFKLSVLDAFHSDKICKKNQRATARKFNINRRQVQKWLSQERDLRDPTQHRGANRQRLGSHSPIMPTHHHEDSRWLVKRERLPSPTTTTTPPTTTRTILNSEETPVDLRTGGIEYNYCGEMSPNSYVDTALTPPYSQTGCTLSCCNPEQPPTYYCYSPPQQQQQPQPQPLSCSQEQPLCLVKPKAEPVSSTVPTPPAPTPPKKDAILFKPYLDNPVSKPAPPSPSSNNNNSHEICNLNDLALDVSFRPQQQHYLQQQQQQQQQPYHLEIPRARSAFVRYPAYLQ